MPITLPPRDSSLDRAISFVGGRVLDAEELNHLQDILTADAGLGLGAVYAEGGSQNLTASVSGANVILQPTVDSLPIQVFVEGRWEIVQPSTLSYDPGKTHGADHVYVNWTLWRVTLDTPGTIHDSSLQDAGTQEQIGDVGQFQISFSATDNSAAAADPVAMVVKNTSPIVVCILPRGKGVGDSPAITVEYPDRAQPGAIGDTQRSGLLKLSSGNSGVACAIDDPLITTPPQISTANVIPLVPVDPAANDDLGLPLVVDDGKSGIQADHVIVQTYETSMEQLSWWLVATAQTLQGQVSSLQSALDALTQLVNSLPTSGGDSGDGGGSFAPLSHVGLPLGQSASHPASLVTNSGGWKVQRSSEGAGDESDHAFELCDLMGTPLFFVGHDGEIYSKPSDSLTLNGTFLGRFSALAKAVAGMGDYTTQDYVDGKDQSTGAAALASAKSYTDLKFVVTQPNPGSSTYNTGGGCYVNWTYFKIANLTLAFISGALNDQATLQFPLGFSPANFVGIAAPSQVFGLGSAGTPTASGSGKVPGATQLHFGFHNDGSGTIDAYAENQDTGIHYPSWAQIMGIAWHF